MKDITTKEYEIFKTIGIVTGVADGIVSIIITKFSNLFI